MAANTHRRRTPLSLGAHAYAEHIGALTGRWREQLGRIRANSAVELILDLLPGIPMLFVGLERALASPTGDTLADPPARHVPHRRRS